VVLAFLYLIAPLLNILFSAYLMKRTVSEYLLYTLPTNTWWDNFAMFGILPIAGIAIFAVRKWSYFVFVLTMIFVVILNYLQWQEFPDRINFPLFVGMVIVNVLLVSYFLLPAVKLAYFDRRVRWWEQKPRYVVDWTGELLIGANRHPCQILNFSEGGLLAKIESEHPVGTSVDIVFESSEKTYRAKGVILHTTPVGTGIKFEHTPDSKKLLKDLAKTLKAEGYPLRIENEHWTVSLLNWLRGLPSGEGFTPDTSSLPDELKRK
jgi:hypothetical protein